MIEYHKTIIFTKVPLNGYYRYQDYFQIYPCNLDNMPISKMQRHFPNILEFKTTGEHEFSIPEELKGLENLYDLAAKTTTLQDKYITLLSSFTNNLFFRYKDFSGFWGVPILYDNIGEEANTWSSKWCMSMYHFPELPTQFKINSFTEIHFPQVEKVPHKDYFLLDPNIDFDRTKNITFPSSIDLLFDIYFKLDNSKREYIDTAANYNVSAIELRENRKTLSLLSSFTALETMVNLEFKDFKPENCKECGQPKYKISKKFSEFLLKYIGNSDTNKKKFNAYYSLRSKIVHAGEQLKTEQLFNNVIEEQKDKEFGTSLEILQIGKLAITNWLLFNKKDIL